MPHARKKNASWRCHTRCIATDKAIHYGDDTHDLSPWPWRGQQNPISNLAYEIQFQVWPAFPIVRTLFRIKSIKQRTLRVFYSSELGSQSPISNLTSISSCKNIVSEQAIPSNDARSAFSTLAGLARKVQFQIWSAFTIVRSLFRNKLARWSTLDEFYSC